MDRCPKCGYDPSSEPDTDHTTLSFVLFWAIGLMFLCGLVMRIFGVEDHRPDVAAGIVGAVIGLIHGIIKTGKKKEG
jgi:hypothetical protein